MHHPKERYQKNTPKIRFLAPKMKNPIYEMPTFIIFVKVIISPR